MLARDPTTKADCDVGERKGKCKWDAAAGKCNNGGNSFRGEKCSRLVRQRDQLAEKTSVEEMEALMEGWRGTRDKKLKEKAAELQRVQRTNSLGETVTRPMEELTGEAGGMLGNSLEMDEAGSHCPSL